MAEHPEPGESPTGRREQAELAAYADGRLDPRRAEAVAARVAASAELQAAVAIQRRAISAIRGAEAAAPDALRARVAGLRSGAVSRRRARLALGGALAGAIAAAAMVVALSLPGPVPGGPSVVQAAALSLRAPTGPPPGQSATRPGVLEASTAGVAYPYWEDRLGWKAIGIRSDRLGRRRVTTVFYARRGQRIGYSIVAGRRLPSPPATTDRVVEGVRLRSFRADGARAVTWVRDGRTCILSGRDVDVGTLFSLAGRGGGQARS